MSGIKTGGQSAVLPGYQAVFVEAAVDTPVDVHTASGSLPFGATGATAVAVPYTALAGKAGLSVTIAGLTGGSSPTVTVALQTSPDGVNWTAVSGVTSGALAANGNHLVAPAAAVLYAFVQLVWTTAGTPTAVTVTDARVIVQNS